MANRLFPSKFLYSFTPDLVRLHCKVTFSTSGASTMTESFGITSVTKNTGTGLYTFAFDDMYYSLAGFDYCVVAASAADLKFQITSVATATGQAIGVDAFKFSDNAAVNPSSVYAYFNFWLDNMGSA